MSIREVYSPGKAEILMGTSQPPAPGRPYIARGGEQTFGSPYEATDVTYRYFVIKADLAALKETCDRYLSTPANRAPAYQPVTPYILFTYGTFGCLRSLTVPDSQRGFVQETECALWLFCAPVEDHGGNPVAVRLTGFCPYLFVDNQFAIASGREVYGFPKQHAALQFPQDPETVFRVSTLVFPSVGDGVREEEREVLSIHPAADAAQHPSALVEAWKTAEGAFRFLADTFLHGHGGTPELGMQFLFDTFQHFTSQSLRIALLKQSRSPFHSDTADLQMILEAPMKFTAVKGWRLLPPGYTVQVADFPSHPIAAELGIQAGVPVQTELAFELEYDFLLEPAQRIAGS